ncbi:hypothetical protein ACVWZ4_000008 [Bradyrhizobium sp. USDA 4472]
MAKLPFNHNPKIEGRHKRLHRLIAKGVITHDPTKAELREAADNAAASRKPTIIPTGKRTRSPERD